MPNTPRVVSCSEASVSPASAPSCGEVPQWVELSLVEPLRGDRCRTSPSEWIAPCSEPRALGGLETRVAGR